MSECTHVAISCQSDDAHLKLSVGGRTMGRSSDGNDRRRGQPHECRKAGGGSGRVAPSRSGTASSLPSGNTMGNGSPQYRCWCRERRKLALQSFDGRERKQRACRANSQSRSL